MAGVNFFAGDFRTLAGTRIGSIVAPSVVVYDLRGEANLEGQGWVPVTREQLVPLVTVRSWTMQGGLESAWSGGSIAITNPVFQARNKANPSVAAATWEEAVSGGGSVAQQAWNAYPDSTLLDHWEEVLTFDIGEDLASISGSVALDLSVQVGLGSGGFYARFPGYGGLAIARRTARLYNNGDRPEWDYSSYWIAGFRAWEEGSECQLTRLNSAWPVTFEERIERYTEPCEKWFLSLDSLVLPMRTTSYTVYGRGEHVGFDLYDVPTQSGGTFLGQDLVAGNQLIPELVLTSAKW